MASVIEERPLTAGEREAEEVIREACIRIEPDDFRFSVEALGTPWDVYRIALRGEPGLVAFRIKDGIVEIGFCGDVGSTPADVARALNAQEN